MHTIVVSMFLAALLWVSQPAAAAGDKLCVGPWSSGSDSLKVVSRCEKLPLDAVGKDDPVLALKVQGWRLLLDPKHASFSEVYRYGLRIFNDGSSPLEVAVADREFVSSPFIDMAQMFSFKLPPCYQVTMRFLSPYKPKRLLVRMFIANMSMTYYQGRWTVVGSYNAPVIVPEFGLYHQEELNFDTMPRVEAKSSRCK